MSADCYKEGTYFKDIYSLFLFDRELRETSFHYLILIEALLRTICTYTFAEVHREPDAYQNQSNFATKDEYREYGLPNYVDNMQRLHKMLTSKMQSNKRDFTVHYKNHHDNIPLWVLANDLTFGNVEHFFNLMKPEEQRTVCRRVAEATGKAGSKNGFFDSREARIGLDILVHARNICAHDERLYCAKIGGRKNADYARLLLYARRYLSEKEFGSFLESIVVIVGIYSERSDVISHILAQMGFMDIEA